MSPYRDVERARRRPRGRLLYLPSFGTWPLVAALLVAAPIAYLAGRTLPPATVSCNTMDVRPSDTKACSTMDGQALGRVHIIACRDTPQALEPLLATGNPLVVPQITATQIDFPAPPRLPFDNMAGCERKDKTEPNSSPMTIIGGNVVVNGRLLSSTQPTTTPAISTTPKDWPSSDRISADTARDLVNQCALSPDSSAQRAVTIVVVRHDYTRSLLVMLAATLLTLAVMLRRRVRITLEGAVLRTVETGWFRVKNRATIPVADIDRAVVATGPCGPLNGKRVELALRSGMTLPLLGDFPLAVSNVHARTAAALNDLLEPHTSTITKALPPKMPRSHLAIAAVAFACALALPFANLAMLRHRVGTSTTAIGALTRLGNARDGSTVVTALMGDRKLAVLADEESRTVRVVDIPAASAPLGQTPDVLSVNVGAEPDAMVMDARGRIFVLLPRENLIAVLEVVKGSLAVTKRIDTESEPTAISLTKDDARLVTVSNWGQTLEVWKTSTFERERSVALPRSPRTLTLSADDATAAIGHEVGGIMSLVDLRTGARTERSLQVLVKTPTKTQQWSPILQERVARVGNTFYATGVRATTGDPNDTRVQYYGSGSVEEHFDVGVLRPGAERGDALGTGILSQVNPGNRGCLLPRAIAPDEKNGWLYVACEGPGRVYKLDLRGKRCHVDEAWGAPFAVSEAPTGLALVDANSALLVWSPAAHTLTVLPYDGDIDRGSHWASGADIARYPSRQWIHELSHATRDVQAALVAHGRELFHATNDHRISASGVACANCHVGGRDDGLTWSTPQGPRQTPVLAGHVTGTAPYGWTGEHPTLPVYLGQTFTRLGGQGLKGDDLDAIVAYVESMPGPRFRPKNEDAVARGKSLFMSAQTQCSSCHAGPTFTDQDRHDVSSKATSDKQRNFDTPSLLFVGGSAPYFHDGRYETLYDLLSKNHDAMGQTSQLTDQQRRDLVSYLTSLGADGAVPPRTVTALRP